jgi:hypothetical protein
VVADEEEPNSGFWKAARLLLSCVVGQSAFVVAVQTL